MRGERRAHLARWGVPVGLFAVAVGVGVGSYVIGRSQSAERVAASAVSRSSTVALSADGASLWVTSPDDDRVVELDRSSLAELRRVEVPGQPQDLTVSGNRILVTGSQSTDLVVIDAQPGTKSIRSVDEVALPCGGSRSVVTASAAGGARPSGGLALVTCPTDDLVAVVDLTSMRAVARVPVRGRPTGVVRSEDTITVSTSGDGRLRTFSLAALIDALPSGAQPAETSQDGRSVPIVRLKPASTRSVWADGDRSVSMLGALDAGPAGTVAGYQVVDNLRTLTDAQIADDSSYGTPLNGRARLEPALAGPCGARFAQVQEPARHLSGPVAVAAAPDGDLGDLVWVVGQFSHSVSVVRCAGGGVPSSRSTTVAAFDVGEGARGIVVAADGRSAYVDVGYDHEVARLDLPAGAVRIGARDRIERVGPAKVHRRSVTDSYLSPLAQAGRRMFADGTDTHLTPFGVVTCASCHPSAGEDGLRWRIETAEPETGAISRKVRRTPAAWQVDTDRKPLHWDGEFATSDALVLSTVQRLLGGDGLLVDTAAISAYLAEAKGPPPAPKEGAGADSEWRRGSGLFAARCATCHADPTGTDGDAHQVLASSAVPAARLDLVITPPLLGVRGKAPYGHDGRATTLEALLRQHQDGKGAVISLTDRDLAAVLAYLRSR